MAHNSLDILGFIRDVARSLILFNKSTTGNATGRLPSKVNKEPEGVRLDQPGHYLTSGPTLKRCILCVHNSVISGFQALRQAGPLMKVLEPVTEESLRMSGRLTSHCATDGPQTQWHS
ncbi:hypothetical protein PoB_004949700 [Plakobranchus ocellatus]|uniref:Uncharacterized protein n=1 Tax=Plakobranchus ocellatus TaxID=259542 RepID=A0AAV4BUH7_9GAST|nr:hypothetical protein PoB_004949700 [Plakobranchus ocellatus]